MLSQIRAGLLRDLEKRVMNSGFPLRGNCCRIAKFGKRTRHRRTKMGYLLDLFTGNVMNPFSGIFMVYIFMLAAWTGYEVIGRVPVILHTPLMSGSNFIHGIILVGALIALKQAVTVPEQVIGFFAVLIATINVVGGYVVTRRMLALFRSKQGM